LGSFDYVAPMSLRAAQDDSRVWVQESVRELADKVKQRGRARLAAEPQAPLLTRLNKRRN
jgi:hypothetical protein